MVSLPTGIRLSGLSGVGGRRLFLPQNLVSTQHTLLQGFEAVGDWAVAGSGAVLAADATHFRQGTQSLALTTGAGVASTIDYYPAPAWDLSQAQTIRLWFYTGVPSYVGGIDIILANGTNFTHTFTASKSGSFYWATSPGWNVITFLTSDFTVGAGSPSWSNTIGRIRIRLTPTTGNVAAASFDNLIAGKLPQGAVVFTFDDSLASVYSQAYAYMRTKRVRGTAYAITSKLGTAGYATTAQAQEMNAAGWDIGNHTKDHLDLSTLSQADAQTQLADAQTALEGLGLTRASQHVAYPNGKYNDTVFAAMSAAGMLTGRSTREWPNEALPVSDPYTIETRYCHNTTTLTTAKGWIDTITTRGEVAVIVLHDLVVSPDTDNRWPIADFQALIDYVVSKNLPCLTISELYRLQSGPITIPR